MPDKDDAPNPDEGDKYIGIEVILPGGYEYQNVTVAHRSGILMDTSLASVTITQYWTLGYMRMCSLVGN